MDYLYVFAGMFVSVIALFRRELMMKKNSFRIILVLSILVFFVGVVLHFTEGDPNSFCGALLTPLMSLGLYGLSRKVFLSRFEREPRDTFLDWQSGLAADRLFNIVYFASAICLELVTMGGMMKLAKAGW